MKPETNKPIKRVNPSFGLNFSYNSKVDETQYRLVANKRQSLNNHPGAITHTLIKGENLATLKLLESELQGKIDLCYIDPPYNTGGDAKSGFTYKDSFRNSGDGERHSTWLTFIYDRLTVTHGLLSERGVIAISIDDSEVAYLRLLCDEVFGEANFIAQVVVDGGNLKNNARFISTTHEYLLLYARNLNKLNATGVKWRHRREGIELLLAQHEELLGKYPGDYAKISKELKQWSKTAPIGKRLKVFFNSDARGLYTYADLSAPGVGARYNVTHPVTGKSCVLPSRGYGLSQEKMLKLIEEDMIIFGIDESSQPLKKLYLKDESDQVQRSIMAYPSRSSTHLLEKMLGKRNSFNNPKNLEFISDIISLTCPADGLVLDYFAGSGTTGHAVLLLNEEGAQRKFILVTKDENQIYDEVTLPRLRAAITGDWLDGSQHQPLQANLETFTLEAGKIK